jgi:hypothetical protein
MKQKRKKNKQQSINVWDHRDFLCTQQHVETCLKLDYLSAWGISSQASWIRRLPPTRVLGEHCKLPILTCSIGDKSGK